MALVVGPVPPRPKPRAVRLAFSENAAVSFGVWQNSFAAGLFLLLVKLVWLDKAGAT